MRIFTHAAVRPNSPTLNGHSACFTMNPSDGRLSTPNLAVRLFSHAADGEIIISESTMASAEFPEEGMESRILVLKGINHPVAVRVLRLEIYQE
jgi:hypothetical protein